jgi:hypothetical protein
MDSRGKLTLPMKMILVCFAWLAASAGHAQTQMLLNPGFESPFVSGVATNWTRNPYGGAGMICTEETLDVHSGTSCQKITTSNLVATNGALLYQAFTLLPGHIYNASVWLRAAGNSQVQFELRNVDNYFEAGATHIVAVGTNWQQAVINGGWQSGTNAQFVVSFLSNGANWVGDASLTDVTSNYLDAPLVNTTDSVPATFFGMHINKTTAPHNWPPLQQGLIRLWDTGTRWNQLETNAGVWTWTHFDACTNVILSNNPNCKLLYTLGQTPEWAALNTNTPDASDGTNGASSEPRDMNDWSNYVFTVATRYKGAIQFYEVWNETDYNGFYSGAISNMVTMTQIAKSVLTNVDPTIKLIGPNITLGGFDWLEQFLLEGGGQYPDIISFHDYPTSRPEDSLAGLVGLRDMLSHYPQVSSLPLWCTEGAPDEGASDTQNQGIASRCYSFWWSQNVVNWNWYAWDLTNVNNVFQVPLSINPPSETPAAAGIAYSNTVNWLVGAQMTSRTIDTNGSWAIELQRQAGTTGYIVWNPDSNAVFNIPVNWSVYQQRDLSNHVASLMGVTSITAGVAPVILDSLPSLGITTLSGGTNLIISWPLTASGFVLDQTHTLGAADTWTPVTNQYVTNSAGIQIMVSPEPATNTFYRLIEP